MSSHPYREVNTDPMSGPLVAAVAAGPHSIWIQFDEKLEGARWQRIHEAVSAIPFESAAAAYSGRELEAFAYGYGYAHADSFLTDAHGLSDEEISDDPSLASHREELFGDYSEGSYFSAVYQSQSILLRAAATPQASTFVNGLVTRMEDAYAAGRDVRVAEQEPAPTESTSPAP